MLNCPNCGAEVFENDNVCSSCGFKLKRTCPNCGAAVSNDARFCGNCGRNFDGGYNNQYRRSYGGNVNKSKSDTVLIIIVCALIALIVIFGAAFVIMGIGGSGDDEAVAVAVTTQAPVQTVAPEPTAEPATPVPAVQSSNNQAVPPEPPRSGSSYIFDSDVYYITNEYLSRQSRARVRLILNEIYARHGYIFSSDEYRNYFMQQSWYSPRYTSDSQVESYFNDVERTNKTTIVNYEKAMGWR